MVKDSVREELAYKISTMAKTEKIENEKAEIISRAEKARAEIRLNLYPANSSKYQAPLKTLTQQTAITKNTVSAESPAEEIIVRNQEMMLPAIPEPKIKLNTPPVINSAAADDSVEQTTVKNSTPVQTNVPPVFAKFIEQKAVQNPVKSDTAELTVKPTSPTLIEFQNKNAVLPEWRLQLQNSVRRRAGNSNDTTAIASASAPAAPANPQMVLATNGATALKAETLEQPAPPVMHSNATLAKALKRIEESRQKFSTEEQPKPSPFDAFEQPAPRPFPYIVSSNPAEVVARNNEKVQKTLYTTKPKAAVTLTEVKAEKFDTNKLPPLPEKVSIAFTETVIETIEPETEEKNSRKFEIKATEPALEVISEQTEVEEFYEEEADDRAPLSLRFNSALFDLIIGSFISVILLAPFMLSSGSLFTLQGLLAFLATCSIVMFIYLTATIGTMGKTFGMRLFSLEIVDIEENAYPTFHQAAVNSSLYLISLALGGLGFLTLFLNHEKRAAHDLLSGTIVVKEYE